jgi:hypothetical protein
MKEPVKRKKAVRPPRIAQYLSVNFGFEFKVSCFEYNLLVRKCVDALERKKNRPTD